MRAGKKIPLKVNADKAIEKVNCLDKIFVIRHTGAGIFMQDNAVDLSAAMKNSSDVCPAIAMDAEDPLFILYTSGSTSKPKGVLHTSGGYLVYAAFTHEHVFSLKPDDIYWCTADVGGLLAIVILYTAP